MSVQQYDYVDPDKVKRDTAEFLARKPAKDNQQRLNWIKAYVSPLPSKQTKG